MAYITQGQCQCDAIKIEVSLEKALSDYAPRKCDCDFCMARDALYLSHPTASLKIYSQQPTKIVQQGSEQAEFHCCTGCDDLIAVMINLPDVPCLGTVNAQLLADKDSLRSAVTVSPRQLAPAEKLERWQQAWMPIEFIIG